MGAGLSVLTGKKYSYITVELYRNQEIVSSSTAVRLPMRSLTSSESASIRLVDIIRSLEFRNVSLLKKVQFSGVEPGVYLVKVYRENPGRGKDREYIGSTPIEIQKDTTVRLPCSPEAKVKIKVSNQKGNGVATVNVRLLKDGVMVAQNITDTQGSAVLTAPSSFLGSYECQMVYQGFQVFDEQVRLRAVRHIIPLSKILELEEYTWVFHLIDTWGLPLDLPVTPQITSEEMVEPVVLPAERVSPTTYQVLHLLPASYQFHLQYKSFVLDETFQVPAEQDSKYVFPVEFPLTLRILDARGIPQYNSLIRISRGGTTMEVSSNTSTHRLSLPPGTYSVVVLSEKTRVAERVVQVMGARSIDVITTQEPLFPLLVILGSLVLLSIALILCILKKSPVYVVFALVLVFSMLALVLPWWSLTGSSSEAETSSTLFLLPLDLVTTVKTPTTLTGNLASLPDVFVQVMVLLPLLMLLGCLFTLVSLLFRHYKKKGVQKVMIGGALLLFLGVIVIFSYAMMVFTEVGVGSYVGHGSVPVSIPGEEALQMSCTWGPGIGFYLCCLLIPILLILLITTLRKKE